MFYFNELYFRFRFFFFSFTFTFLIAYYYKKILFIFLTFPLLSYSNSFNSTNSLNTFIYTHPAELLTIHFLLMLCLASSIQGPYLFWHFIDFTKTSLTLEEHKKTLKILVSFIFVSILFNILCFFLLFPKFWFFFQNFNFSFYEPQTLNFFLELRVQEYFMFVIDFFYIINIFIIIFYVLFVIILFFGFENLLYWKKLFLFVNIVFATLLSPPDVYSQLAILFVLTVFLEILIFINLLTFNLEKKL